MSRKIDNVEIIGTVPSRDDDGFAHLQHFECQNVYDNGDKSVPYICDGVSKGDGRNECVLAVLHCVIDGVPHIAFRKQARPLLKVMGDHPCPWGLPAGCQEKGDTSLLQRCMAEIEEETGIEIEIGQCPQQLGRPMYSSMGWVIERVNFFEMLLSPRQIALLQNGNVSGAQGETMEDGGETRLFSLTKAMRNSKSLMVELAVRRLVEKYYQG